MRELNPHYKKSVPRSKQSVSVTT